MTNSFDLGTGLWGSPPQEAAEEFYAYSEAIDRAESLAQFDAVAKASRGFLSNAVNGRSYVQEIAKKADCGESGSYIRLGDADGNTLFSSLGIYPALAKYNLKKISSIYFGNERLMGDNLEFFSKMVIDACEHADGIGAPEREAVERSFDGYGPQYDVRGKCGFRGVYNFFGHNYDLNKLAGATLTSTWVSRSMLPHFFDLVANRPNVGFITCYDTLGGLMRERCNIGNIVEHLIPMQASIAHQTKRRKGLNGDIGHYPDVYAEVLDAINPPEPGTIYVVAAGILSKGYCTAIKERGGIGIDVGSIADVWMNVKSRPGMSSNFVEQWSLIHPIDSKE